MDQSVVLLYFEHHNSSLSLDLSRKTPVNKLIVQTTLDKIIFIIFLSFMSHFECFNIICVYV